MAGEKAAVDRVAQRRTRRRLKRALNCVYFCCLISKILAERRWGDLVEEVDNVLLESTPRDLPATYFEAMSAFPLPPGWTIHNLPAKLQHQIRTYAKNKIVRLLTPVARLKSLRTHLTLMRKTVVGERGVKGGVTAAALRRASPFLEMWSDAQLNALIGSAVLRVYRAGMWVFPCAETARVNGFVVISGTVAEVRSGGTGREPVTVAEFESGAVTAELRWVLAAPQSTGYLAKSPCALLEFDWRDIERLSQLPAAGAAALAAIRRFIVHQRQQQMLRHFPLRGEDMKRLVLFAKWDEGDVQHLAQMLKPRVYFDGEELCTQGAPCPEAFIICRGTVLVLINGQHRRSLGPGESFGEDVMVFEERSPASLRASGTVEVWQMARGAVFSHLKSTALRRLVLTSAIELRERFMELVRDRGHLAMRLRDTPEFAHVAVGDDVFVELERCLRARVFAAGDRLATGGDDLTTLFIVEAGKITENASDSQVAAHVPPCILGGRFLARHKWAGSLTAVRNTECWILHRRDAMQTLRHHPLLLQRLQQQRFQRRSIMVTAPAGACGVGGSGAVVASGSPRLLASAHCGAHGASGKRLAIANHGHSTSASQHQHHLQHAAPQHSHDRAAVWERRRAARAEEEATLEREKAMDEQRRRALVAPPPPEHPPMFEYEGLRPIAPAPREVFTAFREHTAAEVRRKAGAATSPEEDVVAIRDTAKGLVLLAPPDPQRLNECRIRVQQLLSAELRRLEARDGSRSLVPAPPAVSGGGTAERRVLRDIMRRHGERIGMQRAKCASDADLGAVIAANPFSNFRRRREPVQRMSPLGELYWSSPTTAQQVQPFDPKTYERVIAPSYVSAHGFSEIDVGGDS